MRNKAIWALLVITVRDTLYLIAISFTFIKREIRHIRFIRADAKAKCIYPEKVCAIRTVIKTVFFPHSSQVKTFTFCSVPRSRERALLFTLNAKQIPPISNLNMGVISKVQKHLERINLSVSRDFCSELRGS